MNQPRLSGVTSSSDCQWDGRLYMRNGRGFITMLEAFRATGGTARAEIVGQLLQDRHAGDTVSLAKLLNSGQLFGFEWRASLWIPMFQFDAGDLSLKAGVQRVRAELPPLWSGWTLASWFAAPNERFGGRNAADTIDLDLTAVVQAARGLGAIDAAPRVFVRPKREVAASV